MNKLNLKDYVQHHDQSSKHESKQQTFNFQQEQKPVKNQKKPSQREAKQLKLNTLPCQEIEKDNQQIFLFKSTWEDDMQHFKEEMKGCTSPTFATEILSHANNQSSLFPYTDQINEQEEEASKRTRVSNSRSKSKHNKSLQKFIGDSVSTHRPSNSTVQKTLQCHQSDIKISSNQQEMYLYEMKKLESTSNELRRQNKKLDEKCKQLKERCEELEEMISKKNSQNLDNLMTNEVLLERMKSQSFWKVYIEAEKMIRASMAENNQQSFASPINFMKELQALRVMSSELKKENKSLKKLGDQKIEEIEKLKDKLSTQEAEVEEMRLKCVAYESSIKRHKDEIVKNSKDLQKLSNLSNLEQKLIEKVAQINGLSKQVLMLTSQLEQQKILNAECEKQRVAKKRECKELKSEIESLTKQINSLMTKYNLLEIEKQELSANKKELIEKERLKERIFQLEKELKSLIQMKDQEISRMKVECETKFGKEIEVKESRVKELDTKVEQILGNITELQTQNSIYAEQSKRLNAEVNNLNREISRLMNENKGLSKQINEMQSQNSELSEELGLIRNQSEEKLCQLSQNMKSLTLKLNEQAESLLNQEKLIQELKKQVSQKEELLKVKEYESENLKASLGKGKSQPELSKQIMELQEEISRLEQKLNEALEMYEQVHNEKVELELQLQYAEQEVEKLSIEIEKLSSSNPDQTPSSRTAKINAGSGASEQTLQMVDNLLTIKEEIIKKILIFCPQDYKALLVEYIYYGDMIKDKYFEIINTQLQLNQNEEPDTDRQTDQDQNYQSQDESYLQPEESNFYHHSSTNRNLNHQNSRYNKTKPYQSRKPEYQDSSSEPQSESEELPQNPSQQEEINYLVEEFLKIGKIIDDQTRTHYQNPKSKDRKRNLNSMQMNQSKEKQKERQKEEEFRRSKEKQIQQSKNLLNQLNRKIQKVKENNINNENSFHYQHASNVDRRPISKLNKNFTEDQKYPSESAHRPGRQPLQMNEENGQSNVSRPLFTGKDIKIKNPSMMKNTYQQEQRSQREQEEMMQRALQQTPYQKGSHRPSKSSVNRDNFNHGVMSSKLSMMKISDRIRQ